MKSSMDLSKSLEQLERDYWKAPEYTSYLVTTCHNLRKKPLKDFEIEDLRIMIGQNIGLQYLIPIAIEKLKENILAEGDFCKGDLLKSVLDSDEKFWKTSVEYWKMVKDLYESNKEIFETDNLYRQLRRRYEVFSSWNQSH